MTEKSPTCVHCRILYGPLCDVQPSTSSVARGPAPRWLLRYFATDPRYQR